MQVLTLLLIAALLTACGGSDDTEPTDKAPETPKREVAQ